MIGGITWAVFGALGTIGVVTETLSCIGLLAGRCTGDSPALLIVSAATMGVSTIVGLVMTLLRDDIDLETVLDQGVRP